LEQLVRLLGLGTAAPQRGHELDEPQVAGEPALVAPEPVQADDADRPRAEPRLAEQPPCHRVGGLPPQALEVERAAEADERRGAARAQAEAAQPGGGQSGQVARGRRRMQAVVRARRRPDHGRLDVPRVPCLDQLPSDRAEKRVRDRRGPHRPQAAEPARSLADQRVVREPPEQLGVVVVEPEHETHVVDAGVALRAHGNRAVLPLDREHALRSSVDCDRRVVCPAAHDACRIAGQTPRETQRVRTARLQLGGHGHTFDPTHLRGAVPSADGPAPRLVDLAAKPRAEASPLSRAVRSRPRHDRARRRRHRRAVRRRIDRQLLRGALPVAGAHHRGRRHGARSLSRRVPGRTRGAGRRAGSAVRRRRVRPRLLERRRRARRGRARGSATLRARARPSRAARVRDDAEPLLPARGAHAAAVRPLAPGAAPRPCGPRAGIRRHARPARPAGARIAVSLQRPCTQPRHDVDRDRPAMSIRRPVWALHVLVVGLALHNLVVSQLWRAGVRGAALTAISAWKDVLLAAALVAVFVARRGRLFSPGWCDWLGLAFAVFVIVYGLIPQSPLGGGATHKGVLYAARHDLLPVEAYLLGRALALTEDEVRSLLRTVLATAAGVAALGLLDVYLVPLSFWRHASGWYVHQLGLDYKGLSGLPENFVYNAGNANVFRRLTSTFLSPLAT